MSRVIEGFRVGVMLDGVQGTQQAYDTIHLYPFIRGFTTNPTLMRKAGVTEYLPWAKALADQVYPLPISFEVVSERFDNIYREAQILSTLRDNVFVKVPIIDTLGESNAGIIAALSKVGVQVNVTAILTMGQIDEACDALVEGVPGLISIFSGRIADTGLDPAEHINYAAGSRKAGHGVLWASTRQVFDIQRADENGADFITVGVDILSKVDMLGKDLRELSIETVQMFDRDARAAGYTL